MLKSLLVPLDGSKFSESSLPLATQVAHATGARLHLAHVHVAYEPEQLLGNTPFLYEGLDMDEYDARHLEQEKEYVAGVAKSLEPDVACEGAVLDGRGVVDRLAAHAATVRADMVFITTHGYSGFSRAWLGSVADEMIRNTSIPLLVSRPSLEPREAPALRHILVPLDGSDLAEKALPPAADLARATGARLTLAHVISMRKILGPRIVPLAPDRVEPELDGAFAYLESIADAMREEALEVSTFAAHGTAPAHSIAEIAADLGADLIAMATHGYGGVRRALVGSVADKLLRESTLPLLITRPALAA